MIGAVFHFGERSLQRGVSLVGSLGVTDVLINHKTQLFHIFFSFPPFLSRDHLLTISH